MHITIAGLLMIAAIVLLILAIIGIEAPKRFAWFPAGVLCALLALAPPILIG